MARVQNTLIGKSSGSVGGATFSTWKGINVLKSKAIEVANPQTQLQQNQRNRMSLLVALFRLVSATINIGFAKLATQKSAYNAFVQENLLPANFSGVAPSMVLEYANILLSKGTIGNAQNVAVSGTNASPTAVIVWDELPLPVGGSSSDEVYAAVYNSTQDIWGVNNAGSVLRSAETISVTMPANSVTSDELVGYLFFRNPTTGEVSTSQVETATV